ncbi:hypothetical protein, partial [Aeromonas sp. QDB07]|uniref:hypothetical protein n=1 Tax=Aeromonas sp. QDB07 TaxID=2989838 RepID=UPI0022E2B8FB
MNLVTFAIVLSSITAVGTQCAKLDIANSPLRLATLFTNITANIADYLDLFFGHDFQIQLLHSCCICESTASSPQVDHSSALMIACDGLSKEGANKRGNSSRLTQSFHFFMFEPI